MLVLGMASMASATVIDVVAVGTGSLGNAGTSTDPLYESETIDIAIVLRNVPGSSPIGSSYDGYVLSSMDVSLTVTGPGTLSELGTTKATKLAHSAGFGAWAEPEPAIVGNAIAYMAGTSASATYGIPAAYGADVDLVWNLVLHCTGEGYVTLDLAINGTTEYADYTKSGGVPSEDWKTATNSDLGDLVIHQIPEPVTIALLGLGGLLLRRRR
jgi:hypothetical protein